MFNRMLMAISAALVLGFGTGAQAQQTVAVATVGPVTVADLAGRTCVGQFQVYHPQSGNENAQGASRLTFAPQYNTVSISKIESRLGMAAYKNPHGVGDFVNLGPASDVTFTGDKLLFRNSKGARFTLKVVRQGGDIVLSGEVDPRPANPDWKVAQFSARCG